MRGFSLCRFRFLLPPFVFAFFILPSVVCLRSSASYDFAKSFGDAFTIMPIYITVAELGLGHYDGAFQLMAGALVTQGIIEAAKRGSDLLAKNGHPIPFAKRPYDDDYKGIISGHAGGAFSAASYMFYRYGWASSLPVVALATGVSVARVAGGRHTVLQVLLGSAIAWVVGYYVTTPFHDLHLLPLVSTGRDGSQGIGFMLSF